MKKAKTLNFSLFLSSIFLTTSSFCATEKNPENGIVLNNSIFTKTFCSKVLETIKHSHSIPGLKSEEFVALRPELYKTWNDLVKNSVLEVTGTDKDIRPCFVSLQAIIEHVLSTELKKDITKLTGFIHTPMPSTPLCTPGKISRDLVDASIVIDPFRLFTVKSRKIIIRDYLFKGGDLYVVYPKNGLKKRTEEQQKNYKQELMNYSSHLFDVPLNCDSIPLHLIGATYLFQNSNGETFVFSIKATQANDPKDVCTFGLWFGPIDHPAIRNRINELSAYMNKNGFNVL